MALSRTDLVGEISNTTGSFGTGAYTTSSFTPPSNSLMVVVVEAIENGGADPLLADLTISGGGWTYTNRVEVSEDTSFSTGVRIYTAPVGTAASMAFTVDCGARNIAQYSVQAFAYTGYDTTVPVGVTGSDHATSGFAGPPTPVSFALSGSPATTSEVVAAVGLDRPVAGTTAGVGWSERYDKTNTDWGGLQTQTRTGSSSATVSWVDIRDGGGALFNYAAAAIEVRQLSTVAGTGAVDLGTLNITGTGTVTRYGTAAVGLGALNVVGVGTVTTPRFFTPPTVSEHLPTEQRLLRYFQQDHGVAVLITGGVATEVRYPSQDQILAADSAYLGGYRYQVSSAEATILTNAGYGSYIH